MSTITVSRQTLDNTPTRALAFLRAVGTDPKIRSALAAVGFTDKDVAIWRWWWWPSWRPGSVACPTYRVTYVERRS